MRDAMVATATRDLLGQIVTPAAGNALVPGVTWCADNAEFGGGYPGDDVYLAWLYAKRKDRKRCQFVVAPDVVRGPNGELAPDAQATLDRSAPMLPQIRAMGFPAALVAQNGLEHLTVPWSTFDVLFIGGDDAWKLGPAARALVTEARWHGKRVHLGRVNSFQRLRYARQIGAHTADGTYLAFGPDKNLPKLLAWLRSVNTQGLLWEVA